MNATITNQKRAGVVVLILDRACARARRVIMDKERHYIIIKKSILQDIAILNVHVPNNKASKCMRQ